jgi:hypothetical protein
VSSFRTRDYLIKDKFRYINIELNIPQELFEKIKKYIGRDPTLKQIIADKYATNLFDFYGVNIEGGSHDRNKRNYA